MERKYSIILVQVNNIHLTNRKYRIILEFGDKKKNPLVYYYKGKIIFDYLMFNNGEQED